MNEAEESTETEPSTEPEPSPGTAVEIHRSQTVLAAPAQSFSELKEQAIDLASSSIVPDNYRNKPANILVAGLMGAELGFPVMVALRYVHVIKGKPSLAAEAMNVLIRQAGHSLQGTSTNEGTTLIGRRADNGDTMEVSFTIEDAIRAGNLTRQPDGTVKATQGKDVWVQYPKSMCWSRAISQLARMLFPDVLTGMAYTSEELGGGTDAGDGWIAAPEEVIVATRDQVEAETSLWDTIQELYGQLPDAGKNRVNGWLMKLTNSDGEKEFVNGLGSVDPEKVPEQLLEQINVNIQRAAVEPKQSVSTPADPDTGEVVEDAEIVPESPQVVDTAVDTEVDDGVRTIGDVLEEVVANKPIEDAVVVDTPVDNPVDNSEPAIADPEDEGLAYEAIAAMQGEFTAKALQDALGWNKMRTMVALNVQAEYGNVAKSGDNWVAA